MSLAGEPQVACGLSQRNPREARQEECLDLLIALDSGLPGMCTVAASVDLVAHLGTDADGRRRVRQIVPLPGRPEGGVIETADVFATRDGRLVPVDGYPTHAERLAAAGFDDPSCCP